MNDSVNSSCLRLFFEQASDACAHLDSSGVVVECNPSFRRASGLSRDEMVGRSFREVLSIDEPIPDLSNQTAEPFRFRARFSGGSEPVFEWGLFAHSDSGFGLIGKDVTHEEEAVANQQTAEKRLAAVLETTVDAIITIDSSAKILTVNKATGEIFGYQAH